MVIYIWAIVVGIYLFFFVGYNVPSFYSISLDGVNGPSVRSLILPFYEDFFSFAIFHVVFFHSIFSVLDVI